MKLALASLLIVLNFVFVVAATAEPSAKQNRPNSLGVEQVYDNPNIYLFGIIVDGALIDGHSYTNLRFQPYNTMSLYNETVLFCGDLSEDINNKKGPLIVTYKRVAHRMFKGVPCHEFVSAFEVPGDNK